MARRLRCVHEQVESGGLAVKAKQHGVAPGEKSINFDELEVRSARCAERVPRLSALRAARQQHLCNSRWGAQHLVVEGTHAPQRSGVPRPPHEHADQLRWAQGAAATPRRASGGARSAAHGGDARARARHFPTQQQDGKADVRLPLLTAGATPCRRPSWRSWRRSWCRPTATWSGCSGRTPSWWRCSWCSRRPATSSTRGPRPSWPRPWTSLATSRTATPRCSRRR